MPYVDQKHIPAGKVKLGGVKPQPSSQVKMPEPVRIPPPSAARK
jgi:ribosomal 50S subunit-recycling heat shock protein